MVLLPLCTATDHPAAFYYTSASALEYWGYDIPLSGWAPLRVKTSVSSCLCPSA